MGAWPGITPAGARTAIDGRDARAISGRRGSDERSRRCRRTCRSCWTGCSRCSAPALARRGRGRWSTRRSGRAGHARRCCRPPRPAADRHRRRPRPRSTSPGSGWPPSPAGSRWSRPSTTRSRPSWPRLGAAQRAGRAVRPRGVLPAAGRPGARLRLRQDAPLDMRMDTVGRADRGRGRQHLPGRPSWPGCCATTARSASPAGSRGAIVRERAGEPLDLDARGWPRSSRDSIPAPARRTGGNPAKRTFQALRIEVNGELDVLQPRAARRARRDRGRRPDRRAGLPLAGGPRRQAGAGRALGRHHPARPAGVAARRRPQFRLLTRGAERPDEQELTANPRAASARLRAAERIRTAA